MKLAIFSDIHGNYQATKSIIDDINKSNFDEVICLGDLIGIGPKSKESLELVMKNNVTIISGNHDLYYRYGIDIDNKITEENEIAHHHWTHDCINDFISKDKFDFPLYKEINIYGKKILFQHYILNKEVSKEQYPFSRISIKNMLDIENYCETMDCDYMFVGHEHRGFEVHKNNKHLVCIGSSGCVKDNKTFYTIVDIHNDEIDISKKYIEFDREGLLKDILSFKYPDQEFINKIFFGI